MSFSLVCKQLICQFFRMVKITLTQAHISYSLSQTSNTCTCWHLWVCLYLVEKRQVVSYTIHFFQSFSEIPGLAWRDVPDVDYSCSIVSHLLLRENRVNMKKTTTHKQYDIPNILILQFQDQGHKFALIFTQQVRTLAAIFIIQTIYNCSSCCFW